TIVGEHEIGRWPPLERLEDFFDCRSLVRKKAVAEPFDRHAASPGAAQERFGAGARFACAFTQAGEDDPIDFDVAVTIEQVEDGAATTDFDVVGVGPNAEDPER